MDDTSTRQQRYRDKLQSEGQRQRVFFLSDKAMAQIKKLKKSTNSPSVSHALEALLKDAPKLLAQVKRFAEQYEIHTSQEHPSIEEEMQYSVERGRLINMANKL